MGAADTYAAFLASLGVRGTPAWLAPPATALEIQSAERMLGLELPADLRQLLEAHNGGRLLGAQEWLPVTESGRGLAGETEFLHQGLLADLGGEGRLDVVPGPRTLAIAWLGHTGILYDGSGHRGRLLYLDVIAKPSVVEFARSLEALFECNIALAESGLLRVGDNGPHRDGSPDAAREIFLAHEVAPVSLRGIEDWINRPEYRSFSLD